LYSFLSMKNNLKDRIAVARGPRKADLVLKGGRIVNVFSGEIYVADVAIYKGTVAGIGEYEGNKVIDAASKLILPGLIDSHVHLESSMLTPVEFAKAVLPNGTTAVVADPHEIANVLGKKGIAYILKASEGLPLDFYFMLPSCVPATSLETSGARLKAADLMPFLKHRRVLGLAEIMNYPGVLSGDAGVLQKLRSFSDQIIDGHAPGLSGKDLSAYVGAGITSDHECTSTDEAREKMRLGMTIFIREGSAAKDMEALLPAVTPANSRCFCLATDDFQPGDLKKGINELVKKAIRLGLDPMTAVQMATINPARHFGLKRKGAVLPGYDADLVIIDSFDDFTVEMVFKQGKLVAKGDTCVIPFKSSYQEQTKRTVRIRSVTKQDIRIKAATGHARVIELIPDQIETRHSVLPVSEQGGFVFSDPERDILKLIVIERHKASGNIGLGLVKGFGLRSGAIAGTVAHDSHNIIAAGISDDDILVAVSEIRKLQGGLVVVHNKKVLAEIPLPVAGLISDKPLSYVVKKLAEIEAAVNELGVRIKHPFGTLSFLALPVIPELKLTDMGLVDVNQFKFVELFV
jgi:adenine deaminase